MEQEAFNNHYQARYERQLRLTGFGPEAQRKLQQSRVLVIGAGGLGVAVLQYLASVGIGTIGIADGDTIDIAHLHQQVLYTEDDLGAPKVTKAAAKLSRQNPLTVFKPLFVRITRENALDVIPDFDVVVDATNTPFSSYLINDASVILDKPIVYGTVRDFEGQFTVFNYQNGPTYRCLYPESIPQDTTPFGAGALGVVPGIIGTQLALEVIKIITGIGIPTSGLLQVSNFLSGENRVVVLRSNERNRRITDLQEVYETVEGLPPAVGNLHPSELSDWYSSGQLFYLLDVREADEYATGYLEGSNHIPLPALEQHEGEFPLHMPLVALCQKGGRSMKAAAFLQEKEPRLTIYNLEGGMDGWIAHAGYQRLVLAS